MRDPITGNQVAAQWTFGYHPWNDAEDFALCTDSKDGTQVASTGMVPVNGPWPATVFAGEDEDDDEGGSDDDGEANGEAGVVAAGGTSAKDVQKYRNRAAYWEPTPVFKGMGQEGFAD